MFDCNNRYYHSSESGVACLKQKVKKWSDLPCQKNKQVPKSFTEEFKAYLGTLNTVNVQDVDNKMLERCFFAGLVEHEALTQFRTGNVSVGLREILEVAQNEHNLRFVIENERFVWKPRLFFEPNRTHSGEGFISLLQVLLNLSFWDTVGTLAVAIGLDFAKTFLTFDAKLAADSNGRSTYTDQLPRALLLDSFHNGTNVACLQRIIYIKGFLGQVIGGVAVYTINGQSFCVPCAIGDGAMRIGHYQMGAYFFGQAEMERFPMAKMLLCQDIRLADVIQRMVADSKEIKNKEFVITGHYGSDLTHLPWGYFRNREVVLLCAPCRAALGRVEAYKKALEEVGVRSFHIFPYPLVHTRLPLTSKMVDVDSFSGLERELLQNIITLGTVQRPALMIDKICSEAMEWGAFVEWGSGFGLFNVKEQPLEKLDDPLFRPRGVELGAPDDNAKLLSVFSLGGPTLVHGRKNAGKSLFALPLAKALCTGTDIFGLVGEGHRHHVLVVDSETPPKLFEQRCAQLDINLRRDDTLSPIVIKGLPAGNLWSDIDLSQQAWCDKLLKYAIQRKATVIIIDNITSLVAPGSINSSRLPGVIYKWAEELRKKGIMLVILHHTLKEKGTRAGGGEARGSQEFAIRCHTEIELIGRDQILHENCAPDYVRKHAEKDGATIGIAYKSCKSAHLLEQKVFWFQLTSMDSIWQKIGSCENEMSVEAGLLCGNELEQAEAAHLLNASPELNTGSSSVPDGLSDDAAKVWQWAQTHRRFKRQEVQEAFGLNKKASCMVLKELVMAKCIDLIGQGPATFYRWRE